MAITISMINWKGGVGKTTLTLHLAAGMAHRGKRALMIDLDAQCNLSILALGLDRYVKEVYRNNRFTLKNLFDCYFENETINADELIHHRLVRSSPSKIFTRLDTILSHQDLVLLDLKLAKTQKVGRDHKETTRFEIEKIAVLHQILSKVRDQYDYIFLDCPPNVNLVTQNAFFASDYYIVPAIPDFLSTTGISLIDKFMKDFNTDFKSMCGYAGVEEYKETQFGGIIFNMVDEYGGGPKKTHQETISLIEKQFQGKVFENYLTDGDGIASASSINVPVYAFAALPRSNQNGEKQAEYLNGIIDELITKII